MACFELLLFMPNSKFRSRSCAGADSPQRAGWFGLTTPLLVWSGTQPTTGLMKRHQGQVRPGQPKGGTGQSLVWPPEAARGPLQHSTAHPFVLQEQNSARFQEFGSFNVGNPASCFRDFGPQQAALPHPFEDVTGGVKDRDPPSGVSERLIQPFRNQLHRAGAVSYSSHVE